MRSNSLGLLVLTALTLNCSAAVALADTEQSYNTGIAYYLGQGESKDYCKAFDWLLKAAEKGHVRAQFKLGEMYVRGLGVMKNDAEAIRWWRRAAHRGYASAQYKMGLIYETGYKGLVEQDFSKASFYYKKAIEQGSAQARGRLAHLQEPLLVHRIQEKVD